MVKAFKKNILRLIMFIIIMGFGEACLCDNDDENDGGTDEGTSGSDTKVEEDIGDDDLGDVGDDDRGDDDASGIDLSIIDTGYSVVLDGGCKEDLFCHDSGWGPEPYCDLDSGNCVQCRYHAACPYFSKETPYCNLVKHKCFECVCNQHCARGSGCIDGECAEGLDGGVNIDCTTGEEVEIKQQGVGGCPKGRPEEVETSPECPPDSKSRFVAEGWSTLGRIQPPTECKNTIGNADYPPVNVYVSDFCINTNEITIGEYRQCVNAGACTEPEDLSSAFREHYYDWEVYNDFPVVNVEWVQADDYCKWIGGRLPTAAEWEKSARGPEKYVYPWGDEMPGDDLCDYGNFGVSGRGCNEETCPVGLYPKGRSGYGVNDMMGNVMEQILDTIQYLWGTDRREKIEGSSDPVIYSASCPHEEGCHSSKGAHFLDSLAMDICEIDVSYTYGGYDASPTRGFRCVTWSAVEPTPILIGNE